MDTDCVACRSDGASYSGQFAEGVMHGKGK
jgi:hypothetical protein